MGAARRIERLELFDEFEEWHLIQGHYCVCVGVTPGAARSALGQVGFGAQGCATAEEPEEGAGQPAGAS